MMHWDPAIGLPLLLVSLLALAALYFFGRQRASSATRNDAERADSPRIEPRFGDSGPQDTALPRMGAARDRPAVATAQTAETVPAQTVAAAPERMDAGARQDLAIERIISLFVTAREGRVFQGPDLVVAAEKVGLEYGDMGIFHRLDDRSAALGPVFSVANMVKPGNFDLPHIDTLTTPGLGFFMTLPGPLNALDAWDAMLPAAQRMAELLDGVVLDAERNALGRQGIQHIRDDLRNWDRRHEGEEIALRGR